MNMQNVMTTPFTAAAVNGFDAVASRLPGHNAPWLEPVRRAALARLNEHGFPTRRQEQWKYTDVTPLLQGDFIPASLAAAPETFIEGVRRFDLDCHRVVFVNGVLRRNLSDAVKADGVRVRALDEVLDEDPDALQELLAGSGDESGRDCNSFTALNTAYLHGGVFIELASGAVLEKPLHLVFISVPHDAEHARPVVVNPRILIAAGERSEATVIESHLGLENAANFSNLVTEIALGSGARLKHLRLIEATQDEYHIANLHARLRRDARYENHQICLGGKLVRNDLRVELAAENAETEMSGLFLASGTQHVDNHLDVRHLAPHTRSRQNYRGVLDGRAHGVFNGKVHVAPGAQKIDAQQASNNLLLSKLAEIDTKPELEIYADDVKCSHGATVGQLDESMLFYLRSRGIDAATARGLLIFAFADEVIRGVGIPEIRAHVENVALGRLPDAERLREFV